MKIENVKELLKRSSLKIGVVVLATALVISSSVLTTQNAVPELVSYVDTETTVEISEDEVPLGSSTTVTTSSKTSQSTKKVKLKKAATKTYSKAGKTTTKTSTKKSSTSTATTTTVTVTKKSIVNNYTKGSKINKRVTTTVTTVTKTVVTKTASTSTSSSSSTVSTSSSNASTATTTGTASISSIASKVDSRVANAFTTLGFTIKVDSSVSYSGLFDARTQSITLKTTDTTIYHELGHFVAFVAGNADTSSEFKSIYSSEKSLYTSYNASYVTADSSEYFAESFKEYTLDPATLKASRPQTYAYIQTALNKITSSQISLIKTVYAAVWS